VPSKLLTVLFFLKRKRKMTIPSTPDKNDRRDNVTARSCTPGIIGWMKNTAAATLV